MKTLTLFASVIALALSANAADRAVFVNRAAAIDTHVITGIDSITFGYNEPVSSSSPRMMYLHAAAGTETVAVDDIDSLTWGSVPVPSTGASIDPSGWIFVDAEDLSGDYNPYGNPDAFTVARRGFSATGAAVTQYDEIVKIKRLRFPYPNGTDTTARKVALSEWVFSGDVISGVTNNSALAYSLPNGRWLNPEWTIVQNDSLTLRFFAAHAYGRNGTPLACIEFEVTDGSATTPRVLVSSLTPYQNPVSGLYVPCYEATIDVASLNNGEITANAILYPHVGDAPFDISVDGEPWPSPHYVSVQKHLKATGGTGLRYAYVDGAGSGGSEATATDLTTAKTTAYAEPMAAINDLETDQGGTLSACVLVLAASTVNKFSRYDNTTVGQVPFYIIGEGTNDTRAVYTLPDSSAGGADMSADRLVLENLIVRQTTPSSRLFNNRAQQEAVVAGVSGPLHHRLIARNILFDANGLTESAPWPYVGIVNLYDCASTYNDGMSNVLSRDAYCAHMSLVGCRNIGGNLVYWSIGTDNRWDSTTTEGAGFHVMTARAENDGANMEPNKGPLFAYNWIETYEGRNCFKTDGAYHGAEGAHYVGNVLANIWDVKGGVAEFYGAGPADLNNRGTLDNIVVQHNTGAGGGWGGGPRDNKAGGVDPIFYWQFFWRGNLSYDYIMNGDYNNKNTGGDVYPDGTQVRNWPQRFGTGYRWCFTYEAATETPGYDAFIGDALPLNSVNCNSADGLFPGFENDASQSGTNDHTGGDYAVVDDGAGADKISNLPRLPAAGVCYSIDLFGTAYPLVDADDPDFAITAALPGGVQ